MNSMVLLSALATTIDAAGAGDVYLFWGAALGAAAIVIVIIELFVPSGGLLALLAGAALVGSIVAFFMHGAFAGIAATLTYIILGPVVGMFVFKWWVNSPLGRRMILSSDVGGTDRGEPDDESNADSRVSVAADRDDVLRALIGATGEALTPLRPVGTVRIADQRVDALAELGSIDAGTLVVVTDVVDNQVKVRAR